MRGVKKDREMGEEEHFTNKKRGGSLEYKASIAYFYFLSFFVFVSVFAFVSAFT